MKDAYWFPHDANSRHDPKILALRAAYGTEGYGRFWIVIEMLRNQADYCLPIKSIRTACAFEMQCEPKLAYEFVQKCIREFKLLQSDGKRFWSDRLLRDMRIKDEKSSLGRRAALTRWNKTSGRACDSVNADGDLLQRKESRANAGAMLEEKNIEQNITLEEKEKENNAPSPLNLKIDDPVFTKTFEEWKAYRIEIERPLTALMVNKLVDQWIDKPARFAAAVQHTISMGWVGLREPPKDNEPNERKTSNNFNRNIELVGRLQEEEQYEKI